MAGSPSQNVFSLIRTTLNTLNGYRIFFNFESCWKMAIDDVTRQWFLQPTCLLQGKKNTPTFSFCSVIKHLLVLLSEGWSALLQTYRLLHIPSSQQYTCSVSPRLSKNFLLAWEFCKAHHYSHYSALRYLSSETTWPVLHVLFPSEVPALALWDRSIHHHINILQSCSHSPCFSLLWKVTLQCSGSLRLSCGLLNLCGFYSGLPFLCPTLGANAMCIQEVNKQRM